MRIAFVEKKIIVVGLTLSLGLVMANCRHEESMKLRKGQTASESGNGDGNPDNSGGNDNTAAAGTGFDKQASLDAFKETVYPLLTQGCGSCHAAAVSPTIANEDLTKAHDAIVDNNKVDFAEIDNSRIVLRLKNDNHNCPADCAADALKMKENVQKWVDKLVASGFTPKGISHDLQTPKLAISTGTAVANVIPSDVVVVTADQATALVAPLTMGTDDVDGQAKKYLATPAGSAVQAAGGTTGTANFAFNVPAAGTYFIWGRVKTPDGNSNAGYLKMDNGATTQWDPAETGKDWAWSQPKTGTTPLQFANLAAGAHTVQFKYREGGMKLNALFLTTNKDYVGGGLLDQFYELKFDLKPLTNKNAKLVVLIAKFQDKGAIVKNLKVETDADITISDIRPLVNGKFNPKDAAYRSYEGTISSPGGPLYDKANAMPIILENGFEQDEISFSFGSIK